MKRFYYIAFKIKRLTLIGLFVFAVQILSAQLDVQNGPVTIYYPNGQISSEGFVKDGKPDGIWKTYYTTGILKSEGKRTNFLLDSTWNFYNQLGELVEVINYQLGKKSGYSLKYTYSNPDQPGKQTLIAKELFINDKKEGFSSYYFPTGELKEQVYFSEGKREGYVKEFDRNGTIITLNQYKDNYLISRERINRKDKNGKKQGTYKTFYENGSLKKEENYLEDELHGYFREFDESGKLLQTFRYERGAVVEEIDEEAQEIIDFKRTYDDQGRIVFSGGYRDGIPLGIHRFFDTTGIVINAYIYNQNGVKLSEGIVDEQGIRKGEWKELYENGKIRAAGNYRNNKQSGSWMYYFRNGKTEQEGNFLNGRYDGVWKWYYDTGELWREENYFNGREDGLSVEYNREGSVLEQGNYINGEKDGRWVYDVGDHKEEGNYLIGLREGKWYYFYQDGTKRFEGNYTRGLPDGKQLYFYPSGALEEEQYFKAGLREKTWRKYDDLGNVKLNVFYKNDTETRINGVRVKLPESDIKVIR